MASRLAGALPFLLTVALALPGQAVGGSPDTAALQVTLRNRGLYGGTIDGVPGPATTAAVVRFQSRRGLVPDGVVGPRTRSALGRYARHNLGTRMLVQGSRGWDVAALQFVLAEHGFPSGGFDGDLGPRTGHALVRFQRWARLAPDGVAGPATFAALRASPPRSPLSLASPVRGGLGDRFGPRGDRFHAGIDFPAEAGTGVAAAGPGRVVYAGWHGGFGYAVTIAHGGGVRTLYAHLSRIDVRLGDRVQAGYQIGLVGSSGNATGPHLHFEVRLRGAAVDPLTALS